MVDPEPSKKQEIAQETCANTNIEYTVLEQIKKNKNRCVNWVGDEEIGTRIAQELCAIYSGEGRNIIDHLVEYKATTTLEIQREYGIKERTITESFQRLRNLDSTGFRVLVKGQLIDDSQINYNKPGPKPRIYHLVTANEMHIRAAWNRWRKLHTLFNEDNKSSIEIVEPLKELQEQNIAKLFRYYVDRGQNGIFTPDKKLIFQRLKDIAPEIDPKDRAVIVEHVWNKLINYKEV